MQREPRRWSTAFGSWVHGYGVPRLVRDLTAAGQPVTPFAVHKWIAGSHAPRPDRVAAIENLSAGQITVREIYDHLRCVRATVGGVGESTGRVGA